MMTHIQATLAAIAAAVLVTGASSPVNDEGARTAEDEGRWPDAVAAWKALAAGGDRTATREYLRVLETVGSWSDLESESRRAAVAFPEWDVPRIALAHSLAGRGRVDEAIAVLDAGGSRTLFLLAERGLLLLEKGEREDAARIMKDVARRYRALARSTPRQQFAAARAERVLGSFEEANRLYQSACRDSVDYLDAHLELAGLFREKYQANLAAEELEAAHNLSPDHPDVHLAIARDALQGNRLTQAEVEARRTLKVRPGDPQARIVLSRLALIAQEPQAAEAWIDPVLEANPRDLAARSALASSAYLGGDSTRFEAEATRILDQDPEYVDVFLDLAGLLNASRRNSEAFAFYDRVLSRDPGNATALIESGLLHMREGREKEARSLLERGFQGDPFNIRAYNQLELLDKMDTFAAYDTEHFEIRLEADTDSLFVPLLREALESVYRDLVPRHGWKPTTPTIVEVFPNHEWFSARVTGFPWVEGIPAVCFGDVVAMDSPRTLHGSSNWRDILRHEFGHVLALGMTKRRVPFWFTEGLSVYLEEVPRDESWDANLVGFYTDGALVPVDSLTIAFTRPRSQGQRMLAYHESGLIIGDLVERKGWEVIPRLLRAFGRGRDLDQALREEAGSNLDAFSARALGVVRDRAAALPVWPIPSHGRLARLLARAPEERDRAPFLEQLALAQYQALALEEAAKTAKKLLEVDPDNARGQGILGLIEQAGNPDASGEGLGRAIALGSTDLPVYQALAKLRAAAGDTTGALDLCRQVLDLYPGSVGAAVMRAHLLAATGDREGARAQYRTLLARNHALLEPARELARLDLEAADAEGALAAVSYGEGIIGLDAELEALRGRAYLLLDRDDDAYRRFLLARKLDIKNVETMVGMAQYYLKRTDLDEAAYFARLALRYEPDHAVARRVLAEVRGD